MVYGFLYVERGVGSRLTELFRKDLRVAESKVVTKKRGGEVVSVIMCSTLLMDTLSSNTRVFYFVPLYALDSYEYFVVAHLRRGLSEVKSYLKEKGHKIKVLQSNELPEMPLGRTVLGLSRLYRIISERELCRGNYLESLVINRSLGEASSVICKSRSLLSRERKIALSNYAISHS